MFFLSSRVVLKPAQNLRAFFENITFLKSCERNVATLTVQPHCGVIQLNQFSFVKYFTIKNNNNYSAIGNTLLVETRSNGCEA